MVRKNLMRFLHCDFLEPVLMMESAENRGASNRVASRQTVSSIVLRRRRKPRPRYSRPETHVWSRAIEVPNPKPQNGLEMPLIERNEKIQTFAA